jgi:hypothetical protein
MNTFILWGPPCLKIARWRMEAERTRIAAPRQAPLPHKNYIYQLHRGVFNKRKYPMVI